MRGNHDFLMGPALANRIGATLLDDPTLISLQDTQTVLTHGDRWCLEDIAYQRYRRIIQHSWTKDYSNGCLGDGGEYTLPIAFKDDQTTHKAAIPSHSVIRHCFNGLNRLRSLSASTAIHIDLASINGSQAAKSVGLYPWIMGHIHTHNLDLQLHHRRTITKSLDESSSEQKQQISLKHRPTLGQIKPTLHGGPKGPDSPSI